MPRKLPKYVRQKVAKGRTYLYFDTGRNLVRLPGIKDARFGRAIADALRMRNTKIETVTALTVSHLADLYEKSQEFGRLAPASRKIYSQYLKLAREKIGFAPADRIGAEDVRLIRDRIADTPGAANMLVSTLGSLYSWGRKRMHVKNKPVEGIEKLELGEHEPWPDWLLERALSDPAVQLPVAMLYYTAQRIGDVCGMRWTDIRGGAISLKQEKTDIALTIPIHRALGELLDNLPKAGFAILTRDGKAWEVATLRLHLQAWAKEQDAKIVPHGLLKNAVNALLEAGCSVAETAAISGQTLQTIEHYARKRDTTVLGAAAILRWERKGSKK
jgi:integrase